MLLKSVIALSLAAPLFAAENGLVVHEWGTFTSIAAEDGSAESWVSLSPPADLPCFVYHFSSLCIKCGLNRVRMETPVIYFYSPQPLTASVHVDLPTGLISEWYPQAKSVSRLQQGMSYGNEGNIEWPSVQVLPGAMADLPDAGDRSHYYAARDTDSALLRVGDQFERVLFYRGVANFDIPVQPRFLPDGKLQIRVIGSGGPIPFAILFENRQGKIGYRVLRDLHDKDLAEPLELTAKVESVHQELRDALVIAGLYPMEAAAMVETWRDSWFEEGMRIFYVVPRKMVDAVLPIRIKPTPAVNERVFVGRVELFSPGMQETLKTALVTGDGKTISKFGRFARPFCDRLVQRDRIHISPDASKALYGTQPPQGKGSSPCRLEPAVLPTDQH